MKRKFLVFALAMGLAVGTASAQFGSGIVYDPTNYHNALLRYFQLQQHLIQLQKSYAQLVTQYNFNLRMAQYVQNMPAKYRAQFSTWRNALAPNTYGNTGTWITGINSGQLPLVNSGYQRATTQLFQYDRNHLSEMNADELSRVQSQNASVELADGANMNAMATVGSIRGNDGQAFMAIPYTLFDASSMASARVGWAWIVHIKSSTVASSSMAATASAISSVA